MKSIVRSLAVAAAVSGLSAFAQDIEELDEEEVESSSEVEATESEEAPIEIGGQLHHQKAEAKFFYTLPEVHKLEGVAEFLLPGGEAWAPVEEGRHYPLGSSFRSIGKDTRLTVQFGRECSIIAIGEASFGTRAQGLEEKSRAISLEGGVIVVKLPRNLPEGLFSVMAPGFSVVNPAGESRYRYAKTGDGDRATIRCVTGSLAVEGRHFRILSMRAANEVCIQTSQDMLFTGIYGTRGDYICKLDQGLVKVTDVETGESHINPKFLEWKISPQTAVRIQRAVPAIGKNMSVSVMTFDAAGNLKNRCAFAENRFEINSGEQAPSTKSGQAELVKKAAEVASDTTAVEAEAVETSAAEGEESSDSSASDDDDDLDF